MLARISPICVGLFVCLAFAQVARALPPGPPAAPGQPPPTPVLSATDTDGDGIEDGADNCPNDFNADQNDADGDGLGNVCDADRDGDQVNNEVDDDPDDPCLCLDSDGDGCDDCSQTCLSGDPAGFGPNPDDDGQDTDGDGICDAGDGCPDDFFKTAPGVCGCGASDDADADADGVPDCVDVCPNNRAHLPVRGDGRPRWDLNGDCEVNQLDLAIAQRRPLGRSSLTAGACGVGAAAPLAIGAIGLLGSGFWPRRRPNRR